MCLTISNIKLWGRFPYDININYMKWRGWGIPPGGPMVGATWICISKIDDAFSMALSICIISLKWFFFLRTFKCLSISFATLRQLHSSRGVLRKTFPPARLVWRPNTLWPYVSTKKTGSCFPVNWVQYMPYWDAIGYLQYFVHGRFSALCLWRHHILPVLFG